MKEEKIIAIYGIKDIRTDDVIYVGLTTNYKQRKYHHFRDKLTPIDLYMLDNDRTNFEMFIIERIEGDYDLSELKDKENYYIEYYDTIGNGLNKQQSGNISNDWKEYQKEYQKEYHKSDKWKEYKKEYFREYNKSEKRKEYYKSEKRKEYMRQYYQKKKLEKQR